MKKSQFNNIVVLVVLICTVFLSSCENFFTQIHKSTLQPEISASQEKAPNNTVSVSFTINDSSVNRAISSALVAPDSYTFDFVCSTNAADSFTESNLPISDVYRFTLVFGNTYTLTIQGFKSTNLVCQTSSSLTFTVQKNGALDPVPSIQMRPAGEGDFLVTYNWAGSTANVTEVTAALNDYELNPVTGDPIVIGEITGKTITLTSKPLSAGYYILTVNFLDGEKVILSYKESVSIQAGQTSTSDKAAGEIVYLGQSWFETPPPEIQNAYYIVAPNGDFTVVWTDTISSIRKTYEVKYDIGTGYIPSAETIYSLEGDTYAVKISPGLGSVLQDVSVISRIASESKETIVNSSIRFKKEVSYGGYTYNTENYFEMGTDIILNSDISWSLTDYPTITNGTTDVVISGTTYVPQIAGTSYITTDFNNFDVDLPLYTLKMLPADKCYVSSSGNDDNSGADDLSALATVNEAVTRLNNAHVAEKPYIINVTGEISFSKIIELNSALLPCNITIDGGGSGILNGSETSGVMSIIGDSKTFILQNLLLQNGKNSDGDGGGLFISGTNTIKLNNCTIKNCTASANGGGIYIADGSVTLTGCTIQNCTSSANGGGIYITDGSVTLTGSTIQNCTAESNGGGIYIADGSVRLDKCVIGRNLGTDVAAITATIGGTYPDSSTPYTNKAQNGGGIYVQSGSILIKNGTHVGYNFASADGGGIYHGGGSITFSSIAVSGNLSVVSNVGDMIISNNEAASGSGGGIYFTGTGDFTVSSADISNNTADVMGGGIVVFNGSSGTYNFSGIMNDNRSPNGAAVSFGANLSAVATFDLVMNGYTYNLDKQSPVVFVDADNAGLTLNILPNTMITDGEGTQNAGFIYLTHPAKITISEQLNKKITLDPSDYSEYYTSPILDNPNGVDISTTIYLVDWEDYGINQTSGYIYEK